MLADVAPLVHDDRRGKNVDEAVAVYEGVYNSGDINVGRFAREHFSWRYRVVGDPDVVVGTSIVDAHRWGTVDPGGNYSLVWAVAPGMTIDTERDPIDMPTDVPMMYPVGREFAFDARGSGHHLIRFTGAFLEGIAAVHRGDEPGQLTLTRTPDPDALRRLRAVVAAAAPGLLDQDVDGPVRTLLNTRIAEAVVGAFDVTPTARSTDVGRATMRLAQEYMAEHVQHPVSMTEVARAVGVGTRSLQLAFSEYGRTTPTQFLRDLRLHHAHRALRHAAPHTATVHEVAATWGFTHTGRFARAYRAAFGERPSETLRRPAR